MDVKSQIEIDGGVITHGKGIVPVELHGVIKLASGSRWHNTASFTPMNNLRGIHI